MPGRLRTLLVRGHLAPLFAFGVVVNLLLLVQPLYMLQVYDRVITSSSLETLTYISIFAVAALVLLGFTDVIRNIYASRLAARLEVEVGADALLACFATPRAALGDIQPLRDLQSIRTFLSSAVLFAFMDLPFAPLFLAVLYLIHPDLFWLTVIGMVVLAGLVLANQIMTSRTTSQAVASSINANLAAQAFARNHESLQAMGMARNAVLAWGRDEVVALKAHDRTNRINATFSGFSRFMRLGLQIAVLGYGGYLVVTGDMTAGMIFASSLISGRALQPIDQVIGGWRSFAETRRAWKRLSQALESSSTPSDRMALPAPAGEVEIDQLIVFPPNAGATAEPILKRVSARIAAGDCVAVIGPSGSGKSTLMRSIVGAVDARAGAVRIDGAKLADWDREELGRHLGYLPQEVDLLPGTVAQNIARFDENARDADIIEAARKAQVHDLIQKLPQGYNTVLGPAGMQLSGGQRQRVGLARAFFGNPKLLILDEPNANLDSEGDAALEQALAVAKQDRVTVVIVTQRRGIAVRADKVMILRDGIVEDFGPRDQVLQRQEQRGRLAQEAASSQPTVVSARFGTTTVGLARAPDQN